MIELPVDPYDGISRPVAAALDGFIIPADFFAATAAQDAVELLVATWRDLERRDEIERWLVLRGGKPWATEQDATGSRVEVQSRSTGLDSESAVVIPGEVVSTLQTVLEMSDEDERFVGLDSLDMIILQTRAVCVDDEKLLGHLSLTHGVSFAEIGRTDEERLAQHSAIHWRVPGHGTWTGDD